jgi:response regulator RpfG family c-di-GMP phosphodiesterase
VLLVDDRTWFVNWERILTKSGYTVVTADNGETALEIYGKRKSALLWLFSISSCPRWAASSLEELLKIDPQVVS